MDLAIALLRRLDEPKLGRTEQAQLRCALAKALEDTGNYEAAGRALGEFWPGMGLRPVLKDLTEQAQAEVLLRVGSLTGWLGSVRQVAGAQETAKDLICESMARFEALGEQVKVAEAQIELARCYQRAGAYDEVRVLLASALEQGGALD